jgi:cellulose synthase/poly-beta-1,6-N-acetylglucosamine synthase-like glycosyltransferase
MNASPKFSPTSDGYADAAPGCTVALNRETAAADIGTLHLQTGGIALCITVYNETADAFYSSLVGLAENVALLRRSYPEIVINICVLVDGVHKCSPSMKAVLERLLNSGGLEFSKKHDLICHQAEIDLHDLSIFDLPADEISTEVTGWKQCLTASQAIIPYEQNESEYRCPARLLVALKRDNAGKLDSHWWFFRIFCPHLIPDYCFQMDVGTVPTAHALHELIEAFQRDPCVGAVASGIVPPPPSAVWNLLECWQYVSFANSILLEWPTEEFAGYLSVIPGQLSAIRWDVLAREYASTRDTEASEPLDTYFKGLGSLTPYESMLYLAEDRVLCREIVSDATTKWTISYVDNALAVTDPCGSWDELLRQRKRWCNGYMACRLSFISRMSGFIRAPAVAIGRKLRASTAVAYHSAVLVHDWFALGFCALFLLSLLQRAESLTAKIPVIQNGLKTFSYVIPLVLLMQLCVCLRGELSARSIKIIRFSTMLQSSVIAVSLGINVIFGKGILLPALLIFLCIATPVASLISHRQHTGVIVAATPIAFLNSYVVTALLWMYAICNAHDSSWGTKGLTAATSTNTGAKQKTSRHAKEYLEFRRRYVSAWLVSNCLFVYFLMKWFELSKYSAAIFPLATTALLASIGLFCRVWAKLYRMWLRDSREAKSLEIRGAAVR